MKISLPGLAGAALGAGLGLLPGSAALGTRVAVLAVLAAAAGSRLSSANTRVSLVDMPCTMVYGK